MPLSATTWFVRPNGGTRYSANVTKGQCDGKADVAYPGKGVNRHCAFNDVRYMWMDGTYGNSKWVMAGGDTLVIRGCAALPGQQNSDAPHCRIGFDTATHKGAWCAGVEDPKCAMPPPPSGTAAQHTRILGGCAYETYSCTPVTSYPYTKNNLTQLFGGFDLPATIFLSGSQYVDLEGLEITSHNGACTRVGYPQWPAPCATNSPYSDFSEQGIYTTNTTGNITLQDVYIHGFTSSGIFGPIGGPWTLTRVIDAFNAFAGWNFDDGGGHNDGPGSSVTQSYMTMIGNGCLEEYPITHAQFPAKACWDSNDGGFGDSWSGQTATMDSFTCDHCNIRYNVKDGALGPHTLLKNLSLTNSYFGDNMGQQGKWGMQAHSKSYIANNIIVGGCNRMSETLPGAAQNFAKSTGLKGSYLTNFCRAAGDIFAYFSDANSSVQFINNTIIATSATVFDLNCSPDVNPNGCGSTPYYFTNNLMLGYVDPDYPGSNDEAPAVYYFAAPAVHIVGTHNLEYGVRNGDKCGSNGNVCSDPLLINQPPRQKRINQTSLDNLEFRPSGGSPANRHGTPVSGLSSDHYGSARPNPPSIGAVEPTK